MFRPYMWAIFRLWFNLQSSYTRCTGVFWLGEEGGMLNWWCITWPVCFTRSRETNNYLRHRRFFHQNIRPRPNILGAQQAAGFYVQKDETPISGKHGYDVVRCKAVRLLMGWQWPLGRLSANINESQGCFLAVKALYGLQVPIVYNFNVTHQ